MNEVVNTDLTAQLKGLNVYLIGLMGVGKTAVGQVLAPQLGHQFLDTDALIEQLTGQSISALFTELGEHGFRDLETQVLAELSPYTRLAIATGGGIVTRQMNWSYLRQGLIVWLDVPVTELCTRLQSDTTRPLLQEGDLGERLQTLLEQRRSLYAQADLHISAGAGASPDQIASQILDRIPTVLKPAITPPDCNPTNGNASSH